MEPTRSRSWSRSARWIGRFWSALAGVALVLAALLPATPAAAAPQDVRASYAAPIRSSDGHVDSAASIARLQAMHANTYAFLILAAYDWDDLRLDFAPAAQAAGIKVWVYLVPPSECPGGTSCSGYAPYLKDYAAWGRAIATLSTQYPVVSAWAIDDFNANESFFTSTYTGQIRSAARAIQPTLEFYPVVYHAAITSTFVNSYGAVIDSLILPFRDDPYRDTLWIGSLTSQLDSDSALLATKGRKLILMVYASTLSSTTVTPDVDYVRQVTTIGMEYARSGKIAGVIQYALKLEPDTPQSNDTNFSHGTGTGALVFTVQPNRATSAGDYAAAVATLRFSPGSTSCSMVLWHTDNRATSSPLGYHFKQALVAGALVWERDVASEDTSWYTSSPKDLTSYLNGGGGAAALTLRLYEKKGVSNYQVVARFDDVALTGCYVDNPNFETTGGWTFSRGGGPVLGGEHIYDPVYSTTVLDAVAALYAS